MKNNQTLINSLKNKGLLKSDKLIKAFSKIDRQDFVLDKYRDEAYQDIPLPIGYGQTISQPYTVAFMLNLLDPKPKQTVLDIGCGSAYTTALLAEIVGENGQVNGLEIIPQLVEQGRKNLAKYPNLAANINLAENKEIGYPNKQFDRILVSAAASKLPSKLIDQLSKQGKLVIPINNAIHLFYKNKDGQIEEKEYYGFSFVPLINN